MKEIIQWIKRVALFLAGVTLIVWGYKVNAANNAKAKAVDKAEEKKKTSSSIFGTIELNGSDNADSSNAVSGQTVIETEKKVEESSGTE